VGLAIAMDFGSWDAVGVELIIPGRIERIGQIDALAVTGFVVSIDVTNRRNDANSARDVPRRPARGH
jgi:hypothetical protein